MIPSKSTLTGGSLFDLMNTDGIIPNYYSTMLMGQLGYNSKSKENINLRFYYEKSSSNTIYATIGLDLNSFQEYNANIFCFFNWVTTTRIEN